MGNRTEYLLASARLPQYDIGATQQSANLVGNALLNLVNQQKEESKLLAQQQANDYASQLLGRTNDTNYGANLQMLRGIGAYTSPEMQKQIEGRASDIKDQLTMDIQQQTLQLAKDKEARDRAEAEAKIKEQMGERVGALEGAVNPIIEQQYNAKTGGVSQKVVSQPVEYAQGIVEGYKGISTLPIEEQMKAYQELKPLVDKAYGEYNAYEKLRTSTEAKNNQIPALQQAYNFQKQNIAVQKQAHSDAVELKRLTLMSQFSKLNAEQQDKLNEKKANLQGSLDSVTEMKTLTANIRDIMNKNPNMVTRAFGPVTSKWIPTVTQNTADLEAMVGTLKSKEFLVAIQAMKGMGALSNAEGDKLESAVANLSMSQSPEQFRKNLNSIDEMANKSLKKASIQFGISTPNTSLDSAVKKYKQ